MARTEFGVNDPLTVKVWSKKLAVEAYRKTYINRFIGSDEDALIHEKEDLKKSAGDKITCGLNIQLQGDGVQGDATLEGSEEALQFYDDSLVIDQLRHASRKNGRMTQQRTFFPLRETAMNRLSDWWAQRMDESFANQIAGNTAISGSTIRTGNNATIAPSTNRLIIQGGQSNDQSLTSSDTFTLDLIDVARERAETASIELNTGPVIRPLRIGGEDMYVMFLHDYQATALRASSRWQAVQDAALSGGDVTNNPIFTGALGVYNGVILHRWNRIPNGVNSSTGASVANTKRAVLCGAQAAVIAFGSENGADRFTWYEDEFDYGNQIGVAAGSIYGLKKTKYIPKDDSSTNAEDFGTIVVSTYATAASTS